MIKPNARSSAIFSVSPPGHDLKTKLAAWLVAWANKLDEQQVFIGLKLRSNPQVSNETKEQCVAKGLEHAARLFAEEVRAQHVENIFSKLTPFAENSQPVKTK